ncbi:carbohydrate ABC transporter permease [Shouchella shacheensis]|uniref:carbohydrate ABC transporter permease n=1 Tax=Shouchella shacheensis TaxID=1649580 RepID=UPI00073FA98F|nr:carbohydrate ABC transporter permease [Shouchella shacheensis]
MKKNQKLKVVLYHTFVIAFGFVMLYPVLWMIASSLKPNAEIFQQAASLIPSTLNWENYAQGWEGFGRTGFDQIFANSMFVSGMNIVGALFSSSFVAFGFARLNFRFKKTLFACLIGTLMLPMQITLIPQYILFNYFGWVNTFLPLIVPAFVGGVPFFVFLMIQFIRGVPRELDEAAVMDGCSTFGIFWRIILPLCKPVLVTVTIFAFMWSWDDFFGALIYLNDPGLYTVALGLASFLDSTGATSWGPLLAMATLSLLPQFIIFMFFQKYLVQGIATTGIK